MNTRVQVEHPVTEVQTRIDIVKEQLWIAFTGETALKQSDINPRGHTIECRINARKSALDFQPSQAQLAFVINHRGLEHELMDQYFKVVK